MNILYSLTDKWILAQKFGIPKIQFTDQMKLKKMEYQSMDILVLLRRGNKILTGGDTKCGAKTEGKAIQRLPLLRIHPILKLQNPDTIVDASKCLLTELDITVTWEAMSNAQQI